MAFPDALESGLDDEVVETEEAELQAGLSYRR